MCLSLTFFWLGASCSLPHLSQQKGAFIHGESRQRVNNPLKQRCAFFFSLTAARDEKASSSSKTPCAVMNILNACVLDRVFHILPHELDKYLYGKTSPSRHQPGSSSRQGFCLVGWIKSQPLMVRFITGQDRWDITTSVIASQLSLIVGRDQSYNAGGHSMAGSRFLKKWAHSSFWGEKKPTLF